MGVGELLESIAWYLIRAPTDLSKLSMTYAIFFFRVLYITIYILINKIAIVIISGALDPYLLQTTKKGHNNFVTFCFILY